MSDSSPRLERKSISPPLEPRLEESESLPEPPNPGPCEWLRLSDIIFATFRGEVPRAVSWSAASLMVLSYPDLNVMVSRSRWYLVLQLKDSSTPNWHTIDLFDRPWFVGAEESSCTFIFDLGDVEEGHGQRYYVKTGHHQAFCYLLSHVSYIRGYAVGAILDAGLDD